MRLLHQIPPNTYDDDLALAPRDGPQAVLGLISDLAESALAAKIYVLHPGDVEFADGRPRIALSVVRPQTSLSMGPEVPQGGTVPATLTYSVAAIASLAILGTLEPAPESAELHRIWVEGLRERLKITWTFMPGADRAIELIGRCMAFDPAVRPHPMNLHEEIAQIQAVLQRPPVPEPIPPPAPTPTATLAPAPTRSAPGALPPLSHPLVPYALVTVTLAGLALSIALCTFGAVVGQFADLLTSEPQFAPVTPPPTRAPVAVDPSGVAPASLFDRFDRSARGSAPAIDAAVRARTPLDPDRGPGRGLDMPAIDTIDRPLGAAGAIHATQPRQTQPQPQQAELTLASAPPVPSPPPPRPKTDPPVRPKTAPGSDLRDPWGR